MKDISQYRGIAGLTDQSIAWIRTFRGYGYRDELGSIPNMKELAASDIAEEELRAALRVNIPRLSEENISFVVRQLHITRKPFDRTLDEY